MKTEEFYRKVEQIFKEYLIANTLLSSKIKKLLIYLNELKNDATQDENFKLTCMYVLFEGFYRSIENDNELKKRFTELRLEQWKNHFGTPTITFLLTYAAKIEKTQNFFSCSTSLSDELCHHWKITDTQRFSFDQENSVLIDEKSVSTINMPTKDEESGQFLKTYNQYGGFTTTPCDLISKEFIEYAGIVAKKSGAVLEVGAAFGAATLQALAKGAKVYCNDIDVANLAVIRNRYIKKNNLQESSVTGDDSKLVLLPGSCPNELNSLPKNFFDAILICRVMHFFDGEQIEKSLEQFLTLLKPEGKLFIVCETPYLKNWQRFIPEYEKRKKMGIKWPGEITNPSEYESSGRASSLPKFVHWITKDILETSLKKAKFDLAYISYIDRTGQFPKDLLLDGRESIGAIAIKP